MRYLIIITVALLKPIISSSKVFSDLIKEKTLCQQVKVTTVSSILHLIIWTYSFEPLLEIMTMHYVTEIPWKQNTLQLHLV